MRTKECTACKQILPITDFYKSHISNAGTQIYKPKCKVCENNITKARYANLTTEERKSYYSKSNAKKDYHKDYRLKTKYGITLNQFNEMYEQQNGCCSICNTYVPDNKIVVDHHHKSGIVRKLLCHNCNVVLGHAKEDPNILLKCVEYLRDNFQDSEMA